MKISFSNYTQPTSGAAVVFVLEGRKFTESGAELDKTTKGSLSRAMKAGRFKGKAGQSLHLIAPEGSKLERIMLIGIGKPKDLDEQSY